MKSPSSKTRQALSRGVPASAEPKIYAPARALDTFGKYSEFSTERLWFCYGRLVMLRSHVNASGEMPRGPGAHDNGTFDEDPGRGPRPPGRAKTRSDIVDAISGPGVCVETPAAGGDSGIDIGAGRETEHDVVFRASSVARRDMGRRSKAARDVVGEGVSSRPRVMDGAREKDDESGVFPKLWSVRWASARRSCSMKYAFL